MKGPFLVALTLICATAWAAPPQKHQYIVVKNRYLLQQPNASAAVPLKDEVTHGGGNVDYDGWDRMVVTLPDNAVEAITKHVGTKYLQLVRSVPPSMSATSQSSNAAFKTTTPAPPAESPANVNSKSLRPIATTTSTWDSGTYAYDGAGNITGIGNDTFTYDALSRLSTASIKGNAEGYTYDAYGNLTLKTTTPAQGSPLTVDLATSTDTNRLTAQGYDTTGNLTGTSSTETNVYDPFNMMRRKDVSGYGSEYYIYNASDERIAVISGCTTAATPDCSGALITVSGRDEAGKVLRQFDVPYPQFSTQGWRWLEDYVYRDGLLLASERPAAEGGRRHFHLDHLGSPRLVTGAGGARLSAHDYYPFGVEITNLRQETAAGFDREEPMKFTGHERDFNIGTLTENTNYTDYMHGRFTVPQWGRFLSVDPSRVSVNTRNPQSWNRYNYSLDNPIRYADPNGKWPTEIHNAIINGAFGGLSNAQRGVLRAASARVDSYMSGGQTAALSYQHGMRAPWQTASEARGLADNFIANHNKTAGALAKQAGGVTNAALDAFGGGLHTVTDRTSPEHKGEQVWTGGGEPGLPAAFGPAGLMIGIAIDGERAREHANGEAQITLVQYHDAVDAARNDYFQAFGQAAFQQATGCAQVQGCAYDDSKLPKPLNKPN